MRQNLTPSQKLWIEVFGVYGLPLLDERKVLVIVAQLPQRQAQAVRLRFGFGGVPLSFENLRRLLPRADGKMGVSKELARLEVRKAIHHLRQPGKRRFWQEAEL
jgi:DNA-directed RNA polymerase sigma subunit (sigma70/sigma32)